MRRFAIVLALAAAAALVAGCASSGSESGNAATAPSASGMPTATATAAATTGPAPGGGASSAAPGSAAPATGQVPGDASCATQAWGTGPKGGSTAMSAAPLYLVRVGQHGCYDRVVFDVNGPEAVGYAVRYVPVVRADGSGQPVPVAGTAALEVVVRAPIRGTDSQGHQPGTRVPVVGDDFVSPGRVAAWSSLRQVAFAGSFEGQTTIAVGVRVRLPFRVFVTGDRGYRHVVVDIAH